MSGSDSQLAIHAVLDSYEEAIDALFEAIGSSNSVASQLKDTSLLDGAIERVIKQDQSLSRALDEVHQHRCNSTVLDQLQQEMSELDTKLYAIMHAMQTAHRGLLDSAKETTSEVPLMHETVPVDVLISYANRIAKHTPGTRTGTLDGSKSAFSAATTAPWPSEDLMRRGILATGSINMLKPSEKKRRWQQDAGLAARTDSISREQADSRDKDVAEHNPTTNPAIFDNVNGQQITSAAPAASSAMALDLDLFDPDEED